MPGRNSTRGRRSGFRVTCAEDVHAARIRLREAGVPETATFLPPRRAVPVDPQPRSFSKTPVFDRRKWPRFRPALTADPGDSEGVGGSLWYSRGDRRTRRAGPATWERLTCRGCGGSRVRVTHRPRSSQIETRLWGLGGGSPRGRVHRLGLGLDRLPDGLIGLAGPAGGLLGPAGRASDGLARLSRAARRLT